MEDSSRSQKKMTFPSSDAFLSYYNAESNQYVPPYRKGQYDERRSGFLYEKPHRQGSELLPTSYDSQSFTKSSKRRIAYIDSQRFSKLMYLDPNVKFDMLKDDMELYQQSRNEDFDTMDHFQTLRYIPVLKPGITKDQVLSNRKSKAAESQSGRSADRSSKGNSSQQFETLCMEKTTDLSPKPAVSTPMRLPVRLNITTADQKNMSDTVTTASPTCAPKTCYAYKHSNSDVAMDASPSPSSLSARSPFQSICQPSARSTVATAEFLGRVTPQHKTSPPEKRNAPSYSGSTSFPMSSKCKTAKMDTKKSMKYPSGSSSIMITDTLPCQSKTLSDDKLTKLGSVTNHLLSFPVKPGMAVLEKEKRIFPTFALQPPTDEWTKPATKPRSKKEKTLDKTADKFSPRTVGNSKVSGEDPSVGLKMIRNPATFTAPFIVPPSILPPLPPDVSKSADAASWVPEGGSRASLTPDPVPHLLTQTVFAVPSHWTIETPKSDRRSSKPTSAAAKPRKAGTNIENTTKAQTKSSRATVWTTPSPPAATAEMMASEATSCWSNVQPRSSKTAAVYSKGNVPKAPQIKSRTQRKRCLEAHVRRIYQLKAESKLTRPTCAQIEVVT